MLPVSVHLHLNLAAGWWIRKEIKTVPCWYLHHFAHVGVIKGADNVKDSQNASKFTPQVPEVFRDL